MQLACVNVTNKDQIKHRGFHSVNLAVLFVAIVNNEGRLYVSGASASLIQYSRRHHTLQPMVLNSTAARSEIYRRD